MLLDYVKAFFHYLTPKQTLTRLLGFFANIKTTWFKNAFIRIFIRIYGVNMAEALRTDANEYDTFNDFFTRHLKTDARPIADSIIISPVDGYLAQFGRIESGQLIQAKGRHYRLESLLAGDLNAYEALKNGAFATLYLSPKDYHRVHMPVAGTLLQTTYVPGKLFSVQPATTRVIPNLFARNERLICLFDTHLGLMASIMVGATVVGSMATSWGGVLPRKKILERIDYRNQDFAQPSLPQGGEMGHFQMGSTVILLFADVQAAQWAKQLTVGQAVKFGQPLV
ncbi:archaetidylserine decarboxylase [Legionella sp. W05-934-2]|jgi:phosphatidylserine decarboxylase|uniref:archaetidylserine decarboxylase n=1 Tax=Legionella sp. W05-934-2 TaxID=1198649 RepID=UPI003461B56B